MHPATIVGRFIPLAVIALALVPVGAGAARAVKRDVGGIALGMTTDQILAATKLGCAVNKADDVSCEDPADGSTYKVMMSGGKPSVALSVKRTFCSLQAPPAVLAGLMQAYAVARSAGRPNPNGTSFDVSDSVQANLNVNGGGCKNGGRLYQFTLRDNGLMEVHGGASGTAGTRTDGMPTLRLNP